MQFAIGRAGIAAVLAAGWVFALDRVGAFVVHTPTPLGLRPGLLLVAGLLTIQGGLAVAALLLGGAGRLVRARPWLVGLAFALLAGWPAWYCAKAVTAGDWVAKQPWVESARIGVVVCGVVGAFVLGLLHGWRQGRIWPLLLAGAAAGAAMADATVLPGLYPELHLCLEGAVAVFAAMAAHRLVRQRFGSGWGKVSWGLALTSLVAVIGAPVAAHRLRDQTSALILASPAAANAVPLVLLGGETDMLRVVLTRFDLRPEGPRAGAVGQREPRPDWNVILVVVDTLRADALPPGRAFSKVFTEPDLTPNLDAWIARSDRFRFAYAQASRTMFSMPPMMRSLEGIGTDPLEGVPLAQAMAARGRVPVAVLPQYFLDPEDPPVRALVDGFEDVAFYEKNAQQELVTKAREVLGAHRGRPFFAWIHFYNMHQPGYAHDRILTPEQDGALVDRYKASLRWLDSEWGKLLKVFDELGLTENTVIIFVADHGEHVGEKKREGHGGQVMEAEIRVPWVVSIPGRVGTEHPQTVGNIDVAPTLIDAIGAAPVPSHRGHSVLPLLDDPDAPWPYAYSMRNSRGTILGMSLNRQKMFVYRDGALLHRFDIDKDPEEATNLFDLENPIDQGLLMELLVRRPDLAAREIVGDGGKTNRELLLRLLQSVEAPTASALGQRLRMLVGLVALVPEPALMAELDRLFRDADDATRLVIADALAVTQGDWVAERLVERLQQVARTPTEIELLYALAAQSQREFAGAYVGGQIQLAAREEDAARLDAWLELTRTWRTGATNFGAPFRAAIKALGDASPERIERLLQNLERLNCGHDSVTAEAVQARAEAWLTHENAGVATAAANVLAHLGPRAKSSAPALIAAVRRTDGDIRARCAALAALGDVAQGDAVMEIVEGGKDPLLTYQAIQTLSTLGAAAAPAKPWLEEVRRTHWRGWIKIQAARAIQAIDALTPK